MKMKHLISFALCSIIVLSGCSKENGGSSAVASAQTRKKQDKSRTKVGALVAGPLFSGGSLASYLSGRTFLYAVLPDAADFAAAIANSSLKNFWTDKAFQNVLQQYVNSQNLTMLKQEAVRLSTGELRGPLEFGLSFSRGADNTMAPEIHFLWRTGTQTKQCVRDFTDFVTVVAAKSPSIKISRTTIDNNEVRTLTFVEHPGCTLYFAGIDGSIRVSTDQSFFAPWKEKKQPLVQAPAFQKALQKSGIKQNSLLFAYADLSWLFENLPQQASIPPALLDATGITGLSFVTLGVHRDKGKIRELVYVDWPSEKRNLVSSFFCKANVQGALAVVPEDVVSFGVMGVDFHRLWKTLSGFAVKQFPPAQGMIRQSEQQVQMFLGKTIDEILLSFGNDIVNYTIENGNHMPVPVFLFSLKDADVLRQIALKFDKQFSSQGGQGLLLESVDTIEIFVLQKPVVPTELYFAVCEQYLVISQNVVHVRDFVKNRKGRTDPLTADNEAKTMIDRETVTALTYTDVSRQISYVADFAESSLDSMPGNLQNDAVRTIFFSDEMKSLFRKAGEDIGPVWSAVSTTNDGIQVEISSNCGIVPLGMSAGTATAALAVPRIINERKKQVEITIVTTIRNVLKKQYDFKLKFSRFAQNLRELKRQGLLFDAALARGFKNGYLFKLKSGGPNNWTLEARPADGMGRYFYCDQTGTIRAEEGEPAKSESPVIEQ